MRSRTLNVFAAPVIYATSPSLKIALRTFDDSMKTILIQQVWRLQASRPPMRKTLLAIDVGGSTSRAYLVDAAGHCLGHGRNRGGNPASNTPDLAASAIISAVDAAVADAGGGPFDIVVAQIALAGPQAHVAIGRLETAFRAAGLTGPIVFAGDVQAMFASVTPGARMAIASSPAPAPARSASAAARSTRSSTSPAGCLAISARATGSATRPPRPRSPTWKAAASRRR